MSNEWCQNKKCPTKKTNSQIRGNKGNKYYQSNKAVPYYGYWCSMGCRDAWFNEHKETCMTAVGFIPKQTIGIEDAWYVEYNYTWGNGEQHDHYRLCNKLRGVKHSITQQQAQTPEQIAQNYSWQTIDDIEARELAVQLGLAS